MNRDRDNSKAGRRYLHAVPTIDSTSKSHEIIHELPSYDIRGSFEFDKMWGQYFGRFGYTPAKIRSALLKGYENLSKLNPQFRGSHLIGMSFLDVCPAPECKRTHTFLKLSIAGTLENGVRIETSLEAKINPEEFEKGSYAIVRSLQIQKNHRIEFKSKKKNVPLQELIGRGELWERPKTSEEFAPDFAPQYFQNIETILKLWNVEEILINPQSSAITVGTKTLKKCGFNEKADGIWYKPLCERKPHFTLRGI